MAKNKPTAEKPDFLLRSVRASAQGQYTIAEVWDEGSGFLAINYIETSPAVVGKLNKARPKAAENASQVRFSSRDDAHKWFTQFLEVANDEWLDVWTTGNDEIEPWIVDALVFADNDNVDIAEVAETFGDYVEEWSFARLENIPLIWKPVRVAGQLIVGFKHESGDVSYFAFEDDMGQFFFQKKLAGYSWFMDNTGAPISWNGGKEFGFVNQSRRLLAESYSGDYEEPFDVWELGPERSIEHAIVQFFIGRGDDSAENILFFELGVHRGEGVFTDEEWSMIDKTVSESKDESFGWMNAWVAKEYRVGVAEIAQNESKLYKAMHEFFTNPGFEFHDLVLESWDALASEISASAWEDVFLRGSRAYLS